MLTLKDQKGVNNLVKFITETSTSINVWNDRLRISRSEHDKNIYTKNLRDLIALMEKKLNQSSINPIQKIIIINTYYSYLSQSKKIEMIMHFVHNKITSKGFHKIRDIANIMAMFNNYILALKNPGDSIADVNATYKAMNDLKQYIDDSANNIATEFKLSEKIEGNYWGRNEWLPVAGRIAYCNDDGTFCIRYDNRKAGIQHFVDKKNIRSISKHRASQTKKQYQAIAETYNNFNTNYYARVYMQKDFRKTVLNDDVVINIMSYF